MNGLLLPSERSSKLGEKLNTVELALDPDRLVVQFDLTSFIDELGTIGRYYGLLR